MGSPQYCTDVFENIYIHFLERISRVLTASLYILHQKNRTKMCFLLLNPK